MKYRIYLIDRNSWHFSVIIYFVWGNDLCSLLVKLLKPEKNSHKIYGIKIKTLRNQQQTSSLRLKAFLLPPKTLRKKKFAEPIWASSCWEIEVCPCENPHSLYNYVAHNNSPHIIHIHMPQISIQILYQPYSRLHNATYFLNAHKNDKWL